LNGDPVNHFLVLRPRAVFGKAALEKESMYQLMPDVFLPLNI